MKKFKKTYLIDDDEIFVFGAKRTIEHVDFTENLEVFYNGRDAIDRLNEVQNQESEWPNVIFLDLNMPVLDGWQFLEELVKITPPKETKVFIVTSSINPEDVNKAKQYKEVNRYIVKPISREEFKNILELA